MQVLDYANFTRSLSCEYQTDTDFSIIGDKLITVEGINAFLHPGFYNVCDIRSNNYSSIILSNNTLSEDVFALNILEEQKKRTIATYLAISLNGEIDGETKFLYFNNDRETDSETFEFLTSHQMITKENISFDAQRYFNIEILDNKHARINYNYNNADYYLAANTSNQIAFVSDPLKYKTFNNLKFNYIDETVFYYVLDEASGQIFFIKPQINSTYILGISGEDSSALQLLSASNTTSYFNFSRFSFKIRVNPTKAIQKINTSWATYDTDDINALKIDESNSIFDLKSNILFLSQYHNVSNHSIPTKPIILKNQHTLTNTTNKSNYTDLRNSEPSVANRQYNALFTGNDQEKGNDSIHINYTFYSNDYIAQPDSYSVFKTSESLYPYTQININDTTIAANGAYAGDSPYTSDQIFAEKNYAQGKNGQYLCTWLSAGEINNIWVDRYYNNNKITPLDAAKAVNSDHPNYVDFVNTYLQSNNLTYDFFDKKSDVVFEPNKEYIYYRVGEKRIEQKLQSYTKFLILSSLEWTTYYGDVKENTSNTYDCDGKHYSVVENYSDINANSQVTLSFWLNSNNWNEPHGYQILGNYNNIGFGVINDRAVTPQIIVQSASTLYAYNSDLNLINSTPLSGSHIIAYQGALDTFFSITTNGDIYKLDSNCSITDKQILNIDVIDATVHNNILYLLHSDRYTVTLFDTLTETISTQILNSASSTIMYVNGEITGFIGSKTYTYKDDAVVTLYNDNQLVYSNYKTGDSFTMFKTLSSSTGFDNINDFVIDIDDNIYILYGSYKLVKYNSDRQLIYNTSLKNSLSSTSLSGVSLGYHYEYDENVRKESLILQSINGDEQIYVSKINSNTGTIVNTVYTPAKYSGAINDLTNVKYIKQNYSSSADYITFNLKLPNKYNNLDYTAYTYQLYKKNFVPGAHHFAIRIDGLQGNVSVFVDGNKKYDVNIGQGKFEQLDILTSAIVFGATQFFNGITLSQYLQQPNKFFASNISIEQPYIFSKALTNNDIRLLYMKKSPPTLLTFHLPCGQRNNLDIIKHFFEWGTPGYKSNSIKINIKNAALINGELKEDLKTQITQDIKEVLPININILDVEFVDFD